MEINLYKLKPTRKGLLISFIVLIVLAIPVIYQLRQYNDPSSFIYKNISFQLYKPTRLPDGIRVTQELLGADMPNIHGMWYPWFIWLKPIDMTFNAYISNNTGEGIMEWKAGLKGKYPAPTLALNCTTYSQAPGVCEIRTTPSGQKYEYLNGKSLIFGPSTGEEEVDFIKNGTLISASIYIKNNTPIPQSEWDSFIDSFAPINVDTVRFEHGSPGINVL